jgi:hypothetical protein
VNGRVKTFKLPFEFKPNGNFVLIVGTSLFTIFCLFLFWFVPPFRLGPALAVTVMVLLMQFAALKQAGGLLRWWMSLGYTDLYIETALKKMEIEEYLERIIPSWRWEYVSGHGFRFFLKKDAALIKLMFL